MQTKPFRRLICWLIFVFPLLPTVAGNPPDVFHFQHFGNAEGLAYNTVNSLYQDGRGLLWIGTWDGLCSYDGYGFSCLNHLPLDNNSMPNNEVKCVLVDEQNVLWGGFRAGLFRYENGKEFTSILEKGGNSIQQMAFCGDHKIIASLGSNFHLPRTMVVVDTRSLTATTLLIPGAKTEGVTSILPEGDVVWIGGTHGVIRYDHVNGKFKSGQTAVQKQLQNKIIWSICKAQNGGLYFGTTSEILFKPLGLDTLITLPRLETQTGKSANLICLLSDQSGKLWAGTQEGLFYKSLEASNWTHLRHDPSDPNSLSGNQVTCLLEDRSNVLWVGTRNGGLNKLNLAPKPFRNYHSEFFKTDEFIKVFAIAARSDTTLWIGTTHGLFLFDRTHRRLLAHYEIPEEYDANDELGIVQHRWGEASTIMAICQTRNGRVILGTRWQGLYEFDPVQEIFIPLPDKATCSVRGQTVRHIHENEKGQLWVICSRYQVLEPNTWQCKASRELAANLPSNYLWNLYQESPQTYWIGTQFGWVRWNSETKQAMTLPNERIQAPKETRTEDRAIFCFAPAEHGVWMGTYGSGLIHLDTTVMEETIYTMTDGLANNHVYGILKDEKEDLWMSTNRGISRFNPESRSFRNFNSSEALQIQEFESNSYYQCSDGEMFFGGKGGFVSFYPREFKENSYQGQPLITSFKVFGKELETDSLIFDKRHLRLAATQNFFEIGFSSLDFVNPEDNRYEYMLAPFDENWIALQGEHRTKYTDLPPGSYIFKLKAANSDGKFNGKVLEVYIEVVPELYQRVWFRVLIAILGLGLIGGIVLQRFRLVRERNRRRVSQATSRLEQESLRASVNNHFTANALNSIQSFIARNDKTKAMRYVAKFGRLIRLALENSGSQVHTLAEELETLSLYLELECLRSGNKFEVEVEVDPAIDTYALEVPAMLIQPFLENAIWHGLLPLQEGGRLKLRIWQEAQTLCVSVIDNGVGREQARKNKGSSAFSYTSQGLRLVQERMEMLNVTLRDAYHYTFTDLQDNEGQAIGTRVEIRMPITLET